MKAIFIVGTGRSGTHFLTRLLSGFSNINDPLRGRENPSLLNQITTNVILHKPPSEAILDYYKGALKDSLDHVFLDQHHPNLFFADCYFQTFEDIIYLFPQRSTTQIVSSMLNHPSVLNWLKIAQNNQAIPFPNQFLGLASKKQIAELPIHLLCAARVISHNKYFDKIRKKFGAHKVRGISFENLVLDPEVEFNKVFDDKISLLGNFKLNEKPDKNSLLKYLENLTDVQIKEIEALERAALEK